jgi:hypothetical protein
MKLRKQPYAPKVGAREKNKSNISFLTPLDFNSLSCEGLIRDRPTETGRCSVCSNVTEIYFLRILGI